MSWYLGAVISKTVEFDLIYDSIILHTQHTHWLYNYMYILNIIQWLAGKRAPTILISTFIYAICFYCNCETKLRYIEQQCTHVSRYTDSLLGLATIFHGFSSFRNRYSIIKDLWIVCICCVLLVVVVVVVDKNLILLFLTESLYKKLVTYLLFNTMAI